MIILRLGHNDLAFVDSDLAVNYVTFGSEHRKFAGNRDHHPDAARVNCYIFFKFLIKTNIDLELDCIFRKPMKHRFNNVLSKRKYSQLFMHESNTVLLKAMPLKLLGQWGQTTPSVLDDQCSTIIQNNLLELYDTIRNEHVLKS